MLQKLVEARVRANALYSLYKDAREAEEHLYSMAYEQLTLGNGLDEEKTEKLITEIKKLIDKA